jgi:hypothetical protein
MTGMDWLILWTVLLIGSLLFWVVLLRRVYIRAKNLQRQLKVLADAIGSVKVARQTRLSAPDPASRERGH